jgi:hypothetical protein
MNVNTLPVKHSAPGQYLGFALQPVRLCYHLLTCPKNAWVSLEYLEDVAVHNPDGSVVLEQCKSAQKQNPLTDWAPDLWKAIANWIDTIRSGHIDAEKAEFRLYVTPRRTGTCAQALNDAITPSDATAFTDTIQTSLAKLKKPPTCILNIQKFLDATDDERAKVITRTKVVSIDDDPVDALRKLLQVTISPALVDNICEAAIGMAKQRADELIRRGELAIIEADQFRTEFRAFVQKNNLPGMLVSFSTTPKPAEIDTLLASRPTFIRQIELIEVGSDDRIRAVSDFLRTSADKSIWADKGLIFAPSLKDWDESLLHRHAAISGEISDLHQDKSPQVRGRLAYRRCAILEPPLDGRAVPLHFVHGCFNELADNRRLGWHPDFKTLLDENE